MGNSNSNQHLLNSNWGAELAAQKQQQQEQRQYPCHLTKSTCQRSGSAVCQEGIRGHDCFMRSSNPLPQQQQQQHQPAPPNAPQHDHSTRRFAAASNSSVVSSKRTRTYSRQLALHPRTKCTKLCGHLLGFEKADLISARIGKEEVIRVSIPPDTTF